MKRTYENALKLLESRRRLQRPKDAPNILGKLQSDANSSLQDMPTFRGIPSIVGMKEWLQVLGHSDNDLNSLNVIHIAGTKGKGSTCAFINSFLRTHGRRTGFPSKVGLYTSPHLRDIRERIQIDGQPILKEQFTKYFFEVWDLLFPQHSHFTDSKERLPRYLQLLALLAFHTFIKEGTDAAIIETHHGGEYDVTNILQRPIVTGVTSIGMDHVAQLGPSLENIAWHKAGIFKPETPAFSSLQDLAVVEALKARAVEKRVNLTFVSPKESLPTDARALRADVQKQNCSLAIEITNTFLSKVKSENGNPLSFNDISQGITMFNWPGRFEILIQGNDQWFLDGAHNELSVGQSVQWYSENSAEMLSNAPRILIFSHFSNERDGLSLLKYLASSLQKHSKLPKFVILTTYKEKQDGTEGWGNPSISLESPALNILDFYAKSWKEIDAEATIIIKPSVEEALYSAKDIGKQNGKMQTFVTGSLYLVGAALNILLPSNK